ncbi:hypothetical protein P7C73_g4669, partial [Tremellales sp. Uapishka_1]
MQYSKLVLAAFLGLLRTVVAPPVETGELDASSRTDPSGSLLVISSSNDDGAVMGMGGGDGGDNLASPVAGEESASSVSGSAGISIVASQAGDKVRPDRNAAVSIVVGEADTSESEGESTPTTPSPPSFRNDYSVSVQSTNDGGGTLDLNSLGGSESEQFHIPIALAGSKTLASGGSSISSSGASDSIQQGYFSAATVGSYGSRHTLRARQPGGGGTMTQGGRGGTPAPHGWGETSTRHWGGTPSGGGRGGVPNQPCRSESPSHDKGEKPL